MKFGCAKCHCHCYNFAWIYRSWTFGDPNFYFYRSLSLPFFYILRKREKNLYIRSLKFLLLAPLNSALLSSSFSYTTASNFLSSMKRTTTWKKPTYTKYDKNGSKYFFTCFISDTESVSPLSFLYFDTSYSF